VTGGGYVGGLIGSAESGTVISNSFSTGDITGTEGLGGLVGYTDSTNGSVSINNSYATGDATGDVTGTGSEIGANDVGGLIGKISGTVVSLSYSSGTVYGASNVGGLIGTSARNSFISACYTTRSAEDDRSWNGMNVGGFGGNFSMTTVVASFAVGRVIDNAPVGGGLLGVGANDGSVIFIDSYWATDSTQHTGAEGNNNKAVLTDSFGVLLDELECAKASAMLYSIIETA
jgi:hypothetical protein